MRRTIGWAIRSSLVGLGLLAILGCDRFVFVLKPPVVSVAPIEGIIDLGLAPYVQLVLNEATDAGADRFHAAFQESL